MKYRINDIVFNKQTHTLTKGTETLLLEAKSFLLLLTFITSERKVLSRDALIARTWQGQLVSDGAVNKATSKLSLLTYYLLILKPNLNTNFALTL